MNYDKFEYHIHQVLYNQEINLNVEQLSSAIHTRMKRDRYKKLILYWTCAAIFLCLVGAIIYKLSSHNQIHIATIDGNRSPQGPVEIDALAYMASLENQLERSEENINEMADSEIEDSSYENTHQVNTLSQEEPGKTKSRFIKEKSILSGEIISSNFVEHKNDLIQDGIIESDESQWGRELRPLYLTESLKSTNITGLHSLNSTSIAMAGGRINCPSFDQRSKFLFYIIPEIGVFKPLRNLGFSGGEPSEVYNLRRDGERSLEGIQAALYGRVALRNSGIYLQSGIYYSRQSERMNLEYNFTQLDTVQGIISITQSPTGDTLTVIYGDIIRETNVRGQTVAHHYFQTFDIPIALGYERALGDSGFNFGVEAGIMLNLSLASSGRVLTSPREFTDVDDLNAYKSGVGMSYYAGANISKVFGPGRLYLAARYRHLPATFTEPNIRISQSYNHLGLHLGYIIPIKTSSVRVI